MEKNKKIKENKENTKEKDLEKTEENDYYNQSLKWSIILGNPELDGIRLIFVLMIIIPFSTFYISRQLFYKYKYDIDKINLYSLIICIITIWIILMSTSIYYFKEDFQKVFCPKKNKEKIKED